MSHDRGTVATLKTDSDVAGVQGAVTESFTDTVATATASHLRDE